MEEGRKRQKMAKDGRRREKKTDESRKRTKKDTMMPVTKQTIVMTKRKTT